MLIGLLLVLQIIVSIALVCVVLLQRSEGSGFVGGGGSAGVMSVRGVGDLLTRTTWILGSAFFILALLLTILSGREKGAASVVDRLKVDNIDPTALARPKPTVPPAGTAQPGPAGGAPAPLQAPAPQVNNPFLDQTAPAAPPPSK
ncbi:MAG: preprotein translocase subunit SecG [Proteobacteria bacterium]|nr:preprotein translocase subunit SecG [Pseudomonadota bacterium]